MERGVRNGHRPSKAAAVPPQDRGANIAADSDFVDTARYHLQTNGVSEQVRLVAIRTMFYRVRRVVRDREVPLLRIQGP